jgi:hypothetical protein
VGTWLRAFSELGVEDIAGIDGDYVSDELLVIPREKFLGKDLTQPINLNRRFDLVVSLEVAEHLPSEAAANFVETLTKHGSIVLFSAAVPGQDGTNHQNEQWPEYWDSLFAVHGYRCVDCLRGLLWNDDRVDWWYRQNILLFVAEDALPRFTAFVSTTENERKRPLDLVHPEMLRWEKNRSIGIRTLVKKIPDSLQTTLRWRRERKAAASRRNAT